MNGYLDLLEIEQVKKFFVELHACFTHLKTYKLQSL